MKKYCAVCGKNLDDTNDYIKINIGQQLCFDCIEKLYFQMNDHKALLKIKNKKIKKKIK
jgi:hypothetical protein